MIATLLALGAFIIILGASMWKGRDLGQTLAQRARTAIGAFLACGLLLFLLLNLTNPLSWLAVALAAFAAFFAIIAELQKRHRRLALAQAWMTIAEMNFVPAPPRMTVMAQPLKTNPYVELYSNWNVRKREDGRYGVVPLIPINGALHPRWQAADPNVFDSPSEAWDYAIELRKQNAKAITSTSE